MLYGVNFTQSGQKQVGPIFYTAVLRAGPVLCIVAFLPMDSYFCVCLCISYF